MEAGEIPDLTGFSLIEEANVSQIEPKTFNACKNLFVIYETPNKEIKIFCDKVSDTLYASFVHAFVQSYHDKTFEFMKLVLEGVRLLKLNNKKSNQNFSRLKNYFK